MNDSIENFMREPLEEWILDYPQQVAISTLHLILSQEINDILANTDYSEVEKKEKSDEAEPEDIDQPKEDADNKKKFAGY